MAAAPPGPYEALLVGGSRTAPLYAVRFDKSGRSQSPHTQQALLDHISSEDVSDVHVICHGWNNDFERALERYRDLFAEVRKVRDTNELPAERFPVVVGVFWPSTALVAPWEQGPDMAAALGALDPLDFAAADEVADEIAPEDRDRFYELADRPVLDEDEAEELIEIVAGVGAAADDELDGDPSRDRDEQLTAWAHLEGVLAGPQIPESPEDFGGTGGAGTPAGPEAAGFLGRLNPRSLLRMLTVRQMKDRAGVVGAHGVGDLVANLLAANDDFRLHLTGHSYGARVLMTAIARRAAGDLPRQVRSLLLLQPAVNHLCFAKTLPDGRAGGLRAVPERVELPIISTYSAHDFPLTHTFHLALRRGKDLGEVEIAGTEPPSEYAALGGYGPRGYGGARFIDMTSPKDGYELENGAPEIWAVNGTEAIKGHGDVTNPSTAWALHCLASEA